MMPPEVSVTVLLVVLFMRGLYHTSCLPSVIGFKLFGGIVTTITRRPIKNQAGPRTCLIVAQPSLATSLFPSLRAFRGSRLFLPHVLGRSRIPSRKASWTNLAGRWFIAWTPVRSASGRNQSCAVRCGWCPHRSSPPCSKCRPRGR